MNINKAEGFDRWKGYCFSIFFQWLQSIKSVHLTEQMYREKSKNYVQGSKNIILSTPEIPLPVAVLPVGETGR